MIWNQKSAYAGFRGRYFGNVHILGEKSYNYSHEDTAAVISTSTAKKETVVAEYINSEG